MEQALAAPSDVNRTSSALKTLLQKCTAQKTTNAHLLSKIQKISNSIQVCCRIRPLRNNELRNNEKVVVEPLSETEAGYYDQKAKQWKSFVYDKVFGPDQSQQDIFEEVRVCEERSDELERRVYWISTYMQLRTGSGLKRRYFYTAPSQLRHRQACVLDINVHAQYFQI